MKLLCDYAMRFVGVPYKWGGSNPLEGMDCSQLVQVILRFAGEDPPGDQTAQDLFNYYSDGVKGRFNVFGPGSLAFFGEDARHVIHVGFCVDENRMIEAGGGGSNVVDLKTAIAKSAYVRGSLIRARTDFVTVIRPRYNKIGYT